MLEPQAGEVMCEVFACMTCGRRASPYVVQDGIRWRAVPVDFPDRDPVYALRGR